MTPHDELKVTSYQGSVDSLSLVTPILQFLKQELRSQLDFSLQDEYPSLFGGLTGGESLFIEREKQIVSHVGLVKKAYTHPDFRMQIGLIGSVATRKENRGEGLASYLLQESLKRLKHQGCTIALLWSDQPDFYLPLGFYRSGNEWDFRISPLK
ncbi:MAG: GNAT family N-acetyltransferase, partial [Pseudomonadota bacterium]